MMKRRGEALDIPLEDLVMMNWKLDRIIESLERLERSLISQLDAWIADIREGSKARQAEFFPEKTVAM